MNRNAPQPARLNLRRAILAGILGFIVWKGGWALMDAWFKTEEDRVRDLLQGGIDGARERSPREVSRILSDDFKGPEGWTKEEIHKILVHLLMQEFRVVDVSLSPQPVPVQLDAADKNKATAQFRMRARGKSDSLGDWIEIGDRYSNALLHVSFKKTENGWRVYAVRLADDKDGKP
ncbi:MAG TPA: hypothetical protein VEK08_16155 [Planctomycetota bacterium]|nr:hypothetical protein [Planctomycetota bacterium]